SRSAAVMAGGGAVAVGLLIAAVTVIVVDRSEGPPAGLAQPLPGGAGSAPPAPQGLAWVVHPLLLQLAVRRTWSRSFTEKTVVEVGAPDRTTRLRISSAQSPPDPLTDMIAAERKIDLAGYRRIRIEGVPPSPRDAVWEFSYQDPKSGRMRCERRV